MITLSEYEAMAISDPVPHIPAQISEDEEPASIDMLFLRDRNAAAALLQL